MNYTISKVTTKTGIKHELRVWWPGRNAPQKRRRFDTRKEAQAELNRLLKDEKAGASPLDPPFGQEYLHWRKLNDAEFSPGWKANLDGYWLECKEDLENCQISKLKPAVAKIASKWAGLSQKTRNNKMGFIHAVLNFSVEEERILKNPLGRYKAPKVQAPDIEFWERDEAESFLAFLNERYPAGSKERWRYVAVFVAINTGLRAGEVWGLRKGDFRSSHHSIRIARQFNRVSKQFAQLKGKEARSVPLNTEVEAEVASLTKSLNASDVVFASDSQPIDHDVFHARFTEDVEAWGGRRITFHGLRHTAATLMILAGVDIKSLQTIMGHKDIATTMKYLHALGDSAKHAAKAFSLKPSVKREGKHD